MKYFISVKIENRYQKFEVDAGACYTLIPDNQFKRLGIKRQLEPTGIAFRSYTENVFLPLGKVRVKVEHKGHLSFENLYILLDGFDPLLRRVWVRHLKINLNEIDQNTDNDIQNEIFSIQNITDIEKHFPEVFEQKVGCVPNFTIKLKLRDGAKPSYTPKRNVPYALREKSGNPDPELPVTLATDGSPVGVAAVLSQILDNVEKPVAFASRSLIEAERSYSQLDREALAIIFGVSHFINYIYGRHFVLIADNQPLSRIFHPKTGFPKMTSTRLLRYASFLAGFDYTVKFRKGLENQNVDC
ncbi:hypothetical protein AVEN_30044-1 [Araneus ventricosus]|uniref:Reverse transcriptase RNase H-like domain-containing protein n=1 Tax=Araneus ventricosus TaxID=182803 RepID=A0A4Y2I6B4_ARAVE|nr:hypothetical protein AVEN_30044-1 [Araneus ventricosus]